MLVPAPGSKGSVAEVHLHDLDLEKDFEMPGN
jgi:hypothetical protein